MSLTAIVALALAGAAVILAYRDEKLGAALMTGAAVLAALYLLLGTQDAAWDVPAPVPTVSTAASAQTSHGLGGHAPGNGGPGAAVTAPGNDCGPRR
jgi:hypothetical protein